jgi:hypothetical protein
MFVYKKGDLSYKKARLQYRAICETETQLYTRATNNEDDTIRYDAREKRFPGTVCRLSRNVSGICNISKQRQQSHYPPSQPY